MMIALVKRFMEVHMKWYQIVAVGRIKTSEHLM